MARNERIQNLEAMLQDADRRLAVQNQKFESQLQAVKERLEQARGKGVFFLNGTACDADTVVASKTANAGLGFGRIAKPLRGGGGVAPSVAVLSGGSANPLTRTQEDGASAKRASWFFSNSRG